MKIPKMSPARRSVLVAVIGGMMAASYLDDQGIVDLSLGFEEGGLAEGAFMAITGSLAGCAVLLAFRFVRDLAAGDRK